MLSKPILKDWEWKLFSLWNLTRAFGFFYLLKLFLLLKILLALPLFFCKLVERQLAFYFKVVNFEVVFFPVMSSKHFCDVCEYQLKMEKLLWRGTHKHLRKWDRLVWLTEYSRWNLPVARDSGTWVELGFSWVGQKVHVEFFCSVLNWLFFL